MHWISRVPLCTLALLGLICPAARAQVDQVDLAQRMKSSDVAERNEAFTKSLAIAPEEIAPQLSRTYVELLHEMNGVVSQAAGSGVALATVEDTSFIAALSRRVAQLNDPASISALSRAYYGGQLVSEALAEFGTAAVPDLLRVVDSPTSHYDLVNHGFKTLGLIVQKQGGLTGLPHAVSQGITRSTARRLRGPEHFTTIWAAIDLASVLGEGSLLRILQKLATDPAELEARGISDPEIVAGTQQRAARRLRGG